MSNRDMVHDRLLGMLAVEKRFITEKQLKECMNHIEWNEPDKTLKEILLRKKYLTKAQIQRLESELFPDEPSEESTPVVKQPAFGEIALERNMIDQSQLEKALEEQQNYVSRGFRPQIGQVMFKIGYLTLPQVKKVLEAQLKKILCCKSCGIKKIVYSYNSTIIYQCEKCGLDLIVEEERKEPAKPTTKKNVESTEESDSSLDILSNLEFDEAPKTTKSAVAVKPVKVKPKKDAKPLKEESFGDDEEEDGGIGTLKTLEL